MAALSQTLNIYPSTTILQFSFPNSKLNQPRHFSSFSIPSSRFQPIICSSSNVKPKKHSSSSSTKNKNKNLINNNDDKKKKKKKKNNNKNNVEIAESDFTFTSTSTSNSSLPPQVPTPLPKPPVGFVVDDAGKLLSASSDQLVTLVDPANNLPLECVIRRLFTSSRGDECMLLSPVDMPVQILQNTGDGWLEVSYEEFESLLPAAAFAFAKLRMHLVYSGYCYTARGGFCYTDEDIFDFHADGKDDGLGTESIEITRFNHDGSHYMIHTPSDPLLFVAAKDQNGMLQIADDELLEDPAVISAIDEETEFNALVEEEHALLNALLDAE